MNRNYFWFCEEKIKGAGEDSKLAVALQGYVIMGVFDGCGGSGAKVYPHFGGHTGAWVGSRAAASMLKKRFCQGKFFGEDSEESVTKLIASVLHVCKGKTTSEQTLLGSLSKEFPTTVAFFVADPNGAVSVYWCGDSRVYLLDTEGLHQLTVDDAAVTDALQNLREDAPITNVANASSPFVVHKKVLSVRKPSVLLAATDGCFGYLPSPMAFEHLLLDTLQEAQTFTEWGKKVKERIAVASGDDYTMTALGCAWTDFGEFQRNLSQRQAFLKERYPLHTETEEALFEQWETYRIAYTWDQE